MKNPSDAMPPAAASSAIFEASAAQDQILLVKPLGAPLAPAFKVPCMPDLPTCPRPHPSDPSDHKPQLCRKAFPMRRFTPFEVLGWPPQANLL